MSAYTDFTLTQAAEDIATGAASIQSSVAPTGTTHVRLVATAACRFIIGENPTALATSMLLSAGQAPVFVKIPVGWKVAAIQEAAAGKLNVAFVKITRS